MNLGSTLCATALAVLSSGALATPAGAVAEFQKVFVKHYLDEHPDEEFKTYVQRKVRCFVCHQGKKKENCNPYGAQFAPLLHQEEDHKNEEKVIAALIEVGTRRSDPEAEDSTTYDELIANSELPGGKLEEVRKEPPAPPAEESPAPSPEQPASGNPDTGNSVSGSTDAGSSVSDSTDAE